MTTLSKLAADLELPSDTAYFDYIAESVLNGQRKQAVQLFSAMEITDRCAFWAHIKSNCTHEDYEDVSQSITCRL